MTTPTPRTALALAAALLGSIACAAQAQQTTVASWYFSKVTPGQQVSPSTVFGGSSMSLYPANPGTTLRGTDLDAGTHTRSVYFPGWNHLIPGDDGIVDQVEKYASMLSSDPAFKTAPRGGQDGGSNLLDPEAANYAASVWVLPDAAPPIRCQLAWPMTT